ncbi:MAG TPA: hypothetical protein VE669_05880 [Actinomycetota bacterium]|jgi:hypothetical protein|nr:hypothetical protein [Actinomycetota bacterium]
MVADRADTRPSNRGFWEVILSLVLGGVALIALVVAFRPVARTGAVAFAQSNLRTAAVAARGISEQEGSLAVANAQRLRLAPQVERLLFIDPDQSSNDPEVVSVLATDQVWTGAARADTGDCFWVRLEAREGAAVGSVYGTGTDCSAEEAATAAAGAWPEP